MDKQERLGTEPIGSLLIKFSVPAIIGMMVNGLYNIVDRIFIGNIPEVGGLAITGVGVTMPINFIIMAFGMLVGVGAAANISIFLGKGEREDAEKILGNSVTLTLLFSILLTFIGQVFMKDILYVFGATDSTIVYARQYIEIIIWGTTFNLIGFGINNSIRSDGSPKIAMLSMLIGAFLNIVLDPIFIFVFGLGVRGAALATVISQCASAIWVLYYFTKGKSILKIKKEYLKLEKDLVLKTFAIGMSPFAMQLAASLVQVISNNALKITGGDLAIGAMTIISSIGMVFLMPIFGINQGMQPVVGYNFGAKKYQRVKKAVLYACLAATAIVVVGFIVIQANPQMFIRLFNDDSELLEIATHGIRIYFMFLPFIGFQIVSGTYFQSIGKSKIAMLLSLSRQVILLIPFLVIFPKVAGLDGVWYACSTSDIISSVIAGIFFVISMKKLTKLEKAAQN